MPRFHASVVIPAYNEGSRLPPLLEKLIQLGLEQDALLDELAGLGLEHGARPLEILVVDDGSAPEHLARHRQCVEAAAERLARAGSPHRVRLIEGDRNQGKGAAIRLGWHQADPSSTWLGFLDADGAVAASEFWRLVGLLGDGTDVLAGARILMAGRHIRRSTYRHLQGRVFATLAEWTFHLGFYDTQCGVKFVRSSLLRPHLALLGERDWLLDIEVLALVQRQGGRLREEPIDWADPGGSKVRFGVDALRMLLGLRRIRRRLERCAARGEIRRAQAPRPGVLPSASAADAPPAAQGSSALPRACAR